MFNNSHNILEVHNSSFSSNHATSTGGAVYISHYHGGGYGCTVKNVMFKYCFFKDNFGKGAALEITKHLILAEHSSPLYANFDCCVFHNNSAPISGNNFAEAPVVNIILTHVAMRNCAFNGNHGSALSLRGSKMNFLMAFVLKTTRLLMEQH